MISENEFFKFAKKTNKILRDCYVGTQYPTDPEPDYKEKYGFSLHELSPIKGSSSLTKDNYYFFRKDTVEDCKDDLLALCAMLPKLKTVKAGTAGTIAYIDLIPDGKNTYETLLMSLENIDRFIAILVLCRIGTRGEFIGTEKFSAVTVDLDEKYKSIVNPSAE